jgi:hypothetical protein
MRPLAPGTRVPRRLTSPSPRAATAPLDLSVLLPKTREFCPVVIETGKWRRNSLVGQSTSVSPPQPVTWTVPRASSVSCWRLPIHYLRSPSAALVGSLERAWTPTWRAEAPRILPSIYSSTRSVVPPAPADLQIDSRDRRLPGCSRPTRQMSRQSEGSPVRGLRPPGAPVVAEKRNSAGAHPGRLPQGLCRVQILA